MSAPVRGRSTRARPANRRPKSAEYRARRRVILRRRLVALLTLVSVIALVYCVFFTPLLGVSQVQVRGNSVLTEEEVRDIAAIEPGSPLVRLDLQGIHDRVAAIPRVAAVEVERQLPGTVRLLLTERSPVGSVKMPDGFHLVDSTGKDYAIVPAAAPGVPELVLTLPSSSDPATRAVVGVLNELPEKLRPDVVSVSATTGADVRLTLTGDRVVKWGSSELTPRKAAVLLVLLSKPGTTYDVSSPDLATVS
ncbi:FtsQ-type POTRA domain-containing protein [Lentzea sp. DG1S-22]|uniref:cell division protein FtsQ/DivIB n=1 Tax=Lentzea sp. DG1S-22 TaxID=3108822 RepID=UPI002E7A4A9D|nr:FtsQ-type POTRA domain-containing protein [Lentzea sp. DG1S-22]WVH80430.1 FtsQ-type POTRA domain-containing protein [Lentzea sp. DG1S-22]